LLLSLDGQAGGLDSAVSSITRQIRRMPKNGIPCEWLRFGQVGGSASEKLRSFPKVQFAFNFQGQLRQRPTIFQDAEEAVGPVSSMPPPWGAHAIVVTGSLVDDRLRFRWGYSQNVYALSTMEQLAKQFLEIVRELIAICATMEAVTKGREPA
jgi:non-ribosomal peptide synthase protein (TIGR01720 family)